MSCAPTFLLYADRFAQLKLTVASGSDIILE